MKKIRAVKIGIAALASVGVILSAHYAADNGNADLAQKNEEAGAEQTDELTVERVRAGIAGAVNRSGLTDLPEKPSLDDSERVGSIVTAEPEYEAGPGEKMDYLNITPLIEQTAPVLAEPVPAVTSAPVEPTSYLPVTHVPEMYDDTEDAPEEEPDLIDEALFPEEEPDLTSAVTELQTEFEEAPIETEPVEHIRIDLYQMDPTVGNGTISVPYTYYDFLTPEDIYDPAPAQTEITVAGTEAETNAASKATEETEPAVTEVTSAGAETTVTTTDAEETTTFLEAADINPSLETEEPEPPQAGYLIPSRYTGQEIFTARFDGVTQEVDAYTLVCMICATEMSPSFSQEALKAQAVAAYSYVKYHNVNGLTPSVLVKHEVHDATIAAVDAVFGKCVYYNGKVAQTVYTASTAGSTASGKNVWGGGAPYLESVPTPIDEVYDPNWGIKVTYTEDEMRNKIQNYCGITLSDDPSKWIQIESHYDGRYVDNMIIDGQVSIKGQRFRDGLMHYGLKSWAFDVEYADGIFTFTTYGYGHGVGLSQNGANILGRQGYTYDEILKYYFPGITIE